MHLACTLPTIFVHYFEKIEECKRSLWVTDPRALLTGREAHSTTKSNSETFKSVSVILAKNREETIYTTTVGTLRLSVQV